MTISIKIRAQKLLIEYKRWRQYSFHVLYCCYPCYGSLERIEGGFKVLILPMSRKVII